MRLALPTEVRRWPMISGAWSARQAELDQLAADPLPPPEGLLRLRCAVVLVATPAGGRSVEVLAVE